MRPACHGASELMGLRLKALLLIEPIALTAGLKLIRIVTHDFIDALIAGQMLTGVPGEVNKHILILCLPGFSANDYRLGKRPTRRGREVQSCLA